MKVKLKELADGVSIIELGSLLFGLIYVSGYLVNALYVRSRGIAPLPLLKAQYIETGLVFIMLTGLIAAIPLLIISMAIHGRVKYDQRITPTIVIPVIVTTNFLLVFLFWAVFVTEFEWEASASFLGMTLSVKNLFPAYLLLMLVILPLLPIIRMADFSRKAFLCFPKLSSNIDNILTSKPINVIVQILRGIALVITAGFDYFLLIAIPWLPGFLLMGLYFVVTVLFLIGAVFLVRYLTGIFGETKLRMAVWVVGIPLLLSSYYFCATAYSYVIYNNIPVSRGGKYPTSKAILNHKDGAEEAWPNEVYILEETDDSLYLVSTKVENWFTSHEDVLVIPRSEVVPYRLVHLSGGEPRMNHIWNKPKAAKTDTP